MDQSQTPGDLVQLPDYHGKKLLELLKEKLIREGHDNSKILVKLKEANDAIERAFDACMVANEVEIQEFWDDYTFGYCWYWVDKVRSHMEKRGSSWSEISAARMKAKRAIDAVKEACTTDTERAESERIKNLGGDEIDDESGLVEDIEYVEPDYVIMDKIGDYRDKLEWEGVDESEISMRLKVAEAAIEHVYAVCKFTDEEKRIFRRDIYGKESSYLVSSMLYRQPDDYDVDKLEEMKKRAFKAIRDAEGACGTFMKRRRRQQPKAKGQEGGSCKRPRVNPKFVEVEDVI